MTVKEWCETGAIITENKKSAAYWWLKHILGNADKQMCIKKFKKCLKKNQL